MDERELTREEKIDTLKIFAQMTERDKSLVILGAMLGRYEATIGNAAQAT